MKFNYSIFSKLFLSVLLMVGGQVVGSELTARVGTGYCASKTNQQIDCIKMVGTATADCIYDNPTLQVDANVDTRLEIEISDTKKFDASKLKILQIWLGQNLKTMFLVPQSAEIKELSKQSYATIKVIDLAGDKEQSPGFSYTFDNKNIYLLKTSGAVEIQSLYHANKLNDVDLIKIQSLEIEIQGPEELLTCDPCNKIVQIMLEGKLVSVFRVSRFSNVKINSVGSATVNVITLPRENTLSPRAFNKIYYGTYIARLLVQGGCIAYSNRPIVGYDYENNSLIPQYGLVDKTSLLTATAYVAASEVGQWATGKGLVELREQLQKFKELNYF